MTTKHPAKEPGDRDVKFSGKPRDLPLDEALRVLRALPPNATWFLKWTCRKCGERVTCNEPMTVYQKGYTHQEKEDGSWCGAIYTGNAFGCLVVYNLTEPSGSLAPLVEPPTD